MYRALILVACATSALGLVLDGVCDPSIKPFDKVNVKTVPGLWYAYESVGDDSTSRCPAVRVQVENDKLVLDRIFIEDGAPVELRSLADYKEGKVYYPEVLFSKGESDWDYYTVLDTDSVNTVVIYLCKQLTSTTKKIVSWKFSKIPEIPEYVRERNNAAVSVYPELTAAVWREHAHDNCTS